MLLSAEQTQLTESWNWSVRLIAAKQPRWDTGKNVKICFPIFQALSFCWNSLTNKLIPNCFHHISHFLPVKPFSNSDLAMVVGPELVVIPFHFPTRAHWSFSWAHHLIRPIEAQSFHILRLSKVGCPHVPHDPPYLLLLLQFLLLLKLQLLLQLLLAGHQANQPTNETHAARPMKYTPPSQTENTRSK